jgi:hypothetical protein
MRRLNRLLTLILNSGRLRCGGTQARNLLFIKT